MWSVTLSAEERRICAWVGRERFANANRLARDPGRGPVHNTDQFDIRGAHCEYAASLILNLSWRPSIGRIRDRDVGGLVEVRSTVLAHGRLIVKPADHDDVPYALILAVPSRPYALAGWLFGRQAKQFPLYTEHGDPAHFVPQDELNPNVLLLAWIEEQRERTNKQTAA